MELTYVERKSYETFCDEKGYCIGSYIITTIEIYGDKVYLSSSKRSEKIELEKMKEIVKELKEE